MEEREALVESAEPIELSYELSRDDWIRFNMAYADVGPEWQVALAQQRKNVRWSTLSTAAIFVVGGSLMVGLGSATSGMYLEGALGGLAVAIVICIAGFRGTAFGSTKLADMKAAHLKEMQNADLTDYSGRMDLTIDAQGIQCRTAGRSVSAEWRVVSLREAGGDLMLSGPGDYMLIPARVFETPERAATFRAQIVAWLEAGARPYAERLAKYLKDRDIGCPHCGYNLRGLASERCTECGKDVRLEDLVAGKGRKIVGKV